MRNVSDGLKNRLVADGLWGDFVRMQNDGKESGKSTKVACRDALLDMGLEELADVYYPYSEGKGSYPTKVDKVLSEAMQAEGDDGVEDGGGIGFGIGGGVGGGVGGGSVKSSMRLASAVNGCKISMATFEGKKCARSVAIEWAYIYSAVEDVKPMDAPSALAWVLRLDFIKSSSYKQDLFKAVAAKAIAKEDTEEKKEEKLDGQEEYDILGRLSKSAKEANETKGQDKGAVSQ